MAVLLLTDGRGLIIDAWIADAVGMGKALTTDSWRMGVAVLLSGP
jgi:hypothetical protein